MRMVLTGGGGFMGAAMIEGLGAAGRQARPAPRGDPAN